METIRTYTELSKLNSFEDRFRYAKLDGILGSDTFGFDRYLNQMLYHSKEWKELRAHIIARDSYRDWVCDLGSKDFPIVGKVLIHHLNPISSNDIIYSNELIFDPEFLISVSFETHNAIHYGTELHKRSVLVERKKNDTCLWRKVNE